MRRQFGRVGVVVAAASTGALFGICAMVLGADTEGTRATPAASQDSGAIHAYNGEDAKTLAQEKALPVTAYEDEGKVGGGGAPQEVLVDNETVRVNLVSFKKGFVRPGSLRRRNDQLLVYVDEGAYTALKTADGKPVANPRPRRVPPGSSVFHYHDTVVTENRIDEDYRVLFIEIKQK